MRILIMTYCVVKKSHIIKFLKSTLKCVFYKELNINYESSKFVCVGHSFLLQLNVANVIIP